LSFISKRNKDSFEERFKNRKEAMAQDDLKSKWQGVKRSNKRSGTVFANFTVLLILLSAVIIIWYLLSRYE